MYLLNGNTLYKVVDKKKNHLKVRQVYNGAKITKQISNRVYDQKQAEALGYIIVQLPGVERGRLK